VYGVLIRHLLCHQSRIFIPIRQGGTMLVRSVVLCLILLLPMIAAGQIAPNSLDVFGYFQATFDHSSDEITFLGHPPSPSVRNTFILQQANIFFRKQFNAKLSAFVSLEFTNTYASTRKWGTFRLEEAWVQYRASELFNVKAGLMVPEFNNLNQIKNRMPLLPYITRPFVYEAAAEGVSSLDDYAPQSAFIQIDGAVPFGDVRVDYAVYAGNGDPNFISSAEEGTQYSIGGTDTTTFKMVGGRIGIRTGTLKAGFSATSDKSNRVDIGIGAVQRMRFGGDLSFQLGPLSVESEFISTQEYMDERQSRIYSAAGRINPLLGSGPENMFVYGVLAYDLSEMFYTYAGFEYLESHKTSITRGSMVGGGYRPIDELVLKVQYLHISNEFQGLSSFRSDRVQAGVSVMF
jgi:hypothetical protein